MQTKIIIKRLSELLIMKPLLSAWTLYARWTARYPVVRSIVPFIPIVALWAVIAETGVFPRVFLPGPIEVARSFGSCIRESFPTTCRTASCAWRWGRRPVWQSAYR